MRCRTTSIFLHALLAASSLQAQAPKPVHEILKLADGLYEFRTKESGYICKVLASIGPDGVLLVETDSAALMPKLLEEIKKLGGGFPRIVINSHSHGEHWDGNQALGKAPLYIGHENLRQALQSGAFRFMELDEGILPRLTVRDELTLHFNGDVIRIKSFAGAHDNSDLVIWFTRAKVAFVGALATALKFPTVDGLKGDIRRYPEITRKVLDYLPADVKLVPGHGEDATHAMGEQFLQMLEQTALKVKEGIAQGKSLEAMQNDDLLKDWAGWETSYSKRKYWLGALHAGFTGAADARKAKKGIFEPMHTAIKEKGPAGVAPAYQALKERGDEYQLEDRSLLGILFTLNDLKRDRDLVPFGELFLHEFPKHMYVNQVRLALAEALLRLGEKAKAVAYARQVLEADPKSTGAAALLKQTGTN